MDTQIKESKEIQKDLLPLNGTDFVEFYVGNAKQAAMYYMAAFGFRLVAYKGPETGSREVISYVMQQGKIRFVLTSALQPEHEICQHVAFHGDGVKTLALWVDDAVASWELTTKRGAESAFEPITIEDEFGKVVMAGIKTYGETIHTFVQRSEYSGAF
ncbi:MAG TPA: VOC family protein, partial [Saprospiraceae bacterium]|nr:VOC family protein [Saprospiraceae bacterium]